MSVTDAIRREVDRTAGKLRQMFRRGILTLAGADGFVQVKGWGDEQFDQVELWQQFGLTSRPPAGGEVLLVLVGGRGEGAIAAATTDRAHRPADLAEGEAVLYAKSDSGQAQVRCKPDGNVDLVAGSASATVNVGGDDEALLLGETVQADIITFAGALATELGSSNACTDLVAAAASWLASKGKVA